MRPENFFCVTLLALSLCGCGDDDGSSPMPDGGTPDTGPRRDAGPQPESFMYTPEGCAHSVLTPEVSDAELDGEVVGAAATPDHVHVSWAGPADTTFTVNWRTDRETTRTRVLYGTDMAAVAAAEDADAAAGVSLATGHTFTYASIADGMMRTRIHEVHVCGLTASTRYFYKAGAPGAWSAVYDVTTAPAAGATEPFTFAVLGDSRNDPSIFADIQRQLAERGVDFQVYTGDAVFLGVNQLDWNGFFEATNGGTTVESVIARIPLMPTNGNHEALALNYVAQFALPQTVDENERGEGEQWYAFDYGNAHFVVLDASAPASLVEAQAAFLEADLAAVDRAETPWIFVMHHQAQYSCSNHGSDLELRAAWQPVIDEHRVDFVLNGHDHNYERSRPIRGFQAAMPADGMVVTAGPEGQPVMESGTVYVVAGGAGAPLYDNGTCYHTQISERTSNYVIVEITGRTLHWTAYRLDGSVIDEFTYTK